MLFGKRKIKLDKELYRRLAEAAERAGYASTDEFITHVLEREVAGLEEQLDEKEAQQQLHGLGYIE